MSNITIPVFANQIFTEIIKELIIFSKFKFEFYSNNDFLKKDFKKNDKLVILFLNQDDEKNYKQAIKLDFPLIILKKNSNFIKILQGDFIEQMNMPFSVIELDKKIISLLAKYQFNLTSLISLNDYLINKNERKITKGKIELQLTEREIDFLILFYNNKKPLSRKFILKNVWQYSPESDTHTVETHIHRLRKKILEKFSDKNFIKNNEKGYYI
ncbi:MAG: response regulator transcription factor [Pelagibacterales bacterium]|jgi:DNA-binding response OmpR family regulator|nr:response regulator transcription factor [Pelagibacterales bacterium]